MNLTGAARREFLLRAGWIGGAAMLAGMPESAIAMAGVGGGRPGRGVIESVNLPQQEAELPKNHIKFGVCGMSHDHIYGMIGAVQRGGGELVAAWGGEEDKLAAFKTQFPDSKIVRTQEEILDDPSIQLVLSSQIANERAAIGVKAMKQGKDFLSDKPGITTSSNWPRCGRRSKRLAGSTRSCTANGLK